MIYTKLLAVAMIASFSLVALAADPKAEIKPAGQPAATAPTEAKKVPKVKVKKEPKAKDSKPVAAASAATAPVVPPVKK